MPAATTVNIDCPAIIEKQIGLNGKVRLKHFRCTTPVSALGYDGTPGWTFSAFDVTLQTVDSGNKIKFVAVISGASPGRYATAEWPFQMTGYSDVAILFNTTLGKFKMECTPTASLPLAGQFSDTTQSYLDALTKIHIEAAGGQESC